jgi:hypothetical protein
MPLFVVLLEELRQPVNTRPEAATTAVAEEGEDERRLCNSTADSDFGIDWVGFGVSLGIAGVIS